MDKKGVSMDNNRSLLLWLIAGGVLIAVTSFRATCGMIKKVNIVNRFYPSHYVPTPRFVSKCFKITQSKIPKYLSYQAKITYLYCLFPAVYFLFFCIGDCQSVYSTIVATHVCFTIFNFLLFCSISAAYVAKRNRKNNS